MGPLTPDILLRAYSMGIFPMARSRRDPRLVWVNPERRGILPLDGFRVAKSLRKTLREGRFQVRVDSDFEAVMRACGDLAPDRDDTWISEELIASFVELHRLGLAHSVECRREGRLVGGLYGLALGGLFCGESMFSRETDASKVALVHLVARLKRGGFALLDVQFVTDHLARFGAMEIPREEYLRRLSDALILPARFGLGTEVPWEAALPGI